MRAAAGASRSTKILSRARLPSGLHPAYNCHMRFAVFFSLVACCSGASTTVTLVLSGNGSATPLAGTAYSFSFSGTGTANPLGPVTFTGSGQISDITYLNVTTPVSGTLVLTFPPSGDKLNTTFSIPAGVLIPQLGASTNATGNATITGGTGQFANATGSFPSIGGSGTATGLTTASLQLQGTGTVNTAVPTPTPTPTPAPTNGPVISPKGVVTATAYGASADITPGTWIEIYGTNLSSTTRLWGAADFTNNGTAAPTSLDGVKVTVGGQPAFVDYVSPTQVNALVDSNAAVGPSQLTITNSLGTSSGYALTIKPVLPGLLAPASLLINGKQYAGALQANTQTFEGIPANAAKPGDVITIFGIGFGAVTPTVNAGTIASDLTALLTKPQFSFGNTPADLSYYGLAPGFTGLYQFNLVVPAVTTNPATLLTVNLGGVSGTQTLYLAVQ